MVHPIELATIQKLKIQGMGDFTHMVPQVKIIRAEPDAEDVEEGSEEED